MLKKIFAGLLAVVLILTGSLVAFKVTSNKKYEDGNKKSFMPADVKDDIKYFINEPLTLVNRIITDEEIKDYKKTDTVYIIKSPKRLRMKLPKGIKKIVVIKTQNETIGIFYFRSRQEVRIKGNTKN